MTVFVRNHQRLFFSVYSATMFYTVCYQKSELFRTQS